MLGQLPLVFTLAICCDRWPNESNRPSPKSNSNSLVYELDIHLVLAKQEKLTFNRLAKQLCINGKLPSLPAAGANIRAVTFCHRDLNLVFLAPSPHFSRAQRVGACLSVSRGPCVPPFLPHAPGLPILMLLFSPRKWLSQIDQSPGSATVARGTHRQEEDRHGRQGDAHLLIARPGMIPKCCSGC
jgi:hypothetical protein